MLREVWRWWVESWSAPRRARLVYAVMALGFGALAVAGGVSGNAAVGAIAGGVAAVTAALAMLAPRLSRWTRSER